MLVSLLFDPKRPQRAFRILSEKFRGLDSLLLLLRTSKTTGISPDSIKNRLDWFNSELSQVSYSLLEAFQETLTDVTALVLVVTSFLSMIVDVFNTSESDPNKFKQGLGFFIALIIYVLISSVFCYFKQRRFLGLQRSVVKTGRRLLGIRESSKVQVFEEELVVGDVIRAEAGSILMVDALVLEAEDLFVQASFHAINTVQLDADKNMFLFAGSEIKQGAGTFLVLAVGQNTSARRAQRTSNCFVSDFSLLQRKILNYVEKQTKRALISAFLIFVVCFIRNVSLVFHIGLSFLGFFDALLKAGNVFLILVMISLPEEIIESLSFLLPGFVRSLSHCADSVKSLDSCADLGFVTRICIDESFLTEKLEKEPRNHSNFKETLEKYQKFHLNFLLFTSADVQSATTTATDLGIIEKSDQLKEAILTDEEFKQKALKCWASHETFEFDSKVLTEVSQKLKVLRVSSNENKLIMVKALQSLNETVLFASNNPEDIFALRLANISISNNPKGPQLLKEASSFVLNQEFSSLLSLVIKGKILIETVSDLIKFHFTLTTQLLVVLVIQVLTGQEVFVTPVQLLWICMVADVFALIAFAGERFYDREKVYLDSDKNIFDEESNRNVFIQIIIQTGSYVWVMFFSKPQNSIEVAGDLAVDPGKVNRDHFLFSLFVFMQFFNFIYSRVNKWKKFGVFKSFSANKSMILVSAFLIASHFCLIGFANDYFQSNGISILEYQQLVSICIVSISLDYLVKLIA